MTEAQAIGPIDKLVEAMPDVIALILRLGVPGLLMLLLLWVIRQQLRKYDEIQERRVQEALRFHQERREDEARRGRVPPEREGGE